MKNLNWIPMTDDDWSWLNPPKKPEPQQQDNQTA